ncbi:metallophosphoesterase [Oceanihabitans sp. 2_MG-2023]|uniref:metallophosphoesterase n=1 Tax=Oceanihabitans sp. 2_MG-2023 TaxID=3062661 RepID=UPI0026E464D2|nr:metallophosphoesterase [Oceanihabitans sp. 2_MG-2023]MDO6596252.1 metallophosphoesterase [Oceanihabitans sp. 2_MG-2023]
MKRINTIFGVATSVILAVPIGYYAFNNESIIAPQEEKNIVILDSTSISKKSNTFLVISDTHLHSEWTQAEVVQNGNEADTGNDLWDISLTKFTNIISGASKQPKPDYVILLGDLPWHAYPTDKTSLSSARKNTGKVLSHLRNAAQIANVPLIYAPGNNDSWSGDYRAFTAPNGDTPFALDSLGVKNWPVINSGTCGLGKAKACVADNTRGDLGCYAVYPLGKDGGIRLIILNSVMFKYAHHNSNHLHYYGKPGEQAKDIKNQMDWFTKQFTEGSTEDAIMIGMHIPPGIDGHGGSEIWDTDITYNGKNIKDAFLDIVAENKDRIVGALTSHTHLDGLRKMMYKDKNDSLQFSDLIVSIPAITPRNGNNPSFKQFNYDAVNHEWMNFKTINHDYWPSKTVGSVWKEGKLVSFNNTFKGDTLSTMTKRLDTLSFARLLNNVTSIYKAGGNAANPNEVIKTLIVAPSN